MEESKMILLKNPPICFKCDKPMRYIGDKKVIDNMEKGLNASLTLSEKSLLKLYTCEHCRRVEFYLP